MEAQYSQTNPGRIRGAMYIAIAAMVFAWSCAYTTVQSTGGYAPRGEEPGSGAVEESGNWEPAAPVKKKKQVAVKKTGDAEKKFFEKMSKRDPAFGGKKVAMAKPAPKKIAKPVVKKEPAKVAVKKRAVPAPLKAATTKKRAVVMKKMEPSGVSYFQPRDTAPAAKGGDDATAGKTSLVSYGPTAAAGKKKDAKLFGGTGNKEYYQIGKASWYGPGFNGRPTASGEVFNSRKLTAAHRELPMGSIVIVRNLENGREVVLRINDRGPFVKGRVLDVSEYASERLDFKERGLTSVGIKIIRRGKGKSKSAGTTSFVYARKSIRKPGGKAAEKPVPLKKKIRLDKKDYKNEKVLKDFMSLQVGLFENEFNANSLKFALKKFKLPVFVLKRGKMFVVKMGKFSDRKVADEIRARLNDAGFTAFITGDNRRTDENR